METSSGYLRPKLSRQAIGANEHLLVGQLTSVVGATAEVLYFPWPYTVAYGNAYVIDFMAILNGTTDNDVILTLTINGARCDPYPDDPCRGGWVSGSSHVDPWQCHHRAGVHLDRRERHQHPGRGSDSHGQGDHLTP
jgi:hypothetical protein